MVEQACRDQSQAWGRHIVHPERRKKTAVAADVRSANAETGQMGCFGLAVVRAVFGISRISGPLRRPALAGSRLKSPAEGVWGDTMPQPPH
jgi:hypothetical protein